MNDETLSSPEAWDYRARDELCDASAGYGEHVCCLPKDHAPFKHECRKFRRPLGPLWAAWDDLDGDDEPYACSHEEMDHLGESFIDGHLHVRCTRCGVVYRQIDDPEGPILLDDLTTRTRRRIRYEEVTT